MKFLLAEGFDINAFNAFGATPLQRAAEFGHLHLVQFLCERGADASLRRRNSARGPTALEMAKTAAAAASLAPDPREDARIRANLAKVVKYLESGQCVKK